MGVNKDEGGLEAIVELLGCWGRDKDAGLKITGLKQWWACLDAGKEMKMLGWG